MTVITYDNLLRSRLNYRNGKARGMEWKPVKMPYTPVDYDQDGVPETLEKIIALALKLELPVGEWIGEATKREFNIDPIARELLLSNISDETVHYKAFNYAAEDYLINQSYLDEADNFFKAWNTGNFHPIEKACYAEVGVFLVSLAVMRIFGGETLCTLAGNVSRDEMRHVATNKGILSDMGYNFTEYTSVNKLVDETLSWMLSDLKVPGMGKDFFMQQSKLLIKDGYAPELEELTNGAEDVSSFESPNYILY